MMKIEFFLPMILPTTTHQMKKVSVKKGKPVFYEPPELKNARQKFEAYLAKYVPERKLSGPIQLITKWCYQITNDHKHGDYKITKPDTDNMVKLLKDVMTKLDYWEDDAHLSSDIIEKFWSDHPGLYVCVQELGS